MLALLLIQNNSDRGSVVTNPTYASDWIQEASVAGSRGENKTITFTTKMVQKNKDII